MAIPYNPMWINKGNGKIRLKMIAILEVHVEDSSGNVILDEMKQTEANGFIDLWLLRDDIFNVTITQDGKEKSSEISTFEEDKTCITIMQLG